MFIAHSYQGGFESIFYILVFAFNCAVGGGVIRWSKIDLDTEGTEEVLEEVTDEGVTVVTDSYSRKAIVTDPGEEAFADLVR